MTPMKEPYTFRKVTTPKGREVMAILYHKVFGRRAAVAVYTYPAGACVYRAPVGGYGLGAGRLKAVAERFETDEGDTILEKAGV